MHKTGHEAEEFIASLGPLADRSTCRVYIAPAFPAIASSSMASKGHKVIIGAQNMSQEKKGAYTGEVSADMLADAGARFVLLGHSERRALFHETHEMIRAKLKTALEHDLQPILCIGESKEERDNHETESVLLSQLASAFEGIAEEGLGSLIVAYEPVWAIGTGETATPEMAEQTHLHCRKVLSTLYSETFASKVPILYGGSVKPENTKALLSQPNIDGALVGGASLKISAFTSIIQEAEDSKK